MREADVAAAIESLLLKFDHLVADAQTMTALIDIASTPKRWIEAKSTFQAIREKTLAAERSGDMRAACQYRLEEDCAKTLYNLAKPVAPFNANSADRIQANAVELGRQVGVSEFGDVFVALTSG